MAELIAVSGAPGAGKTTVAIQLGLALSRKKQRTVVVFCDSACPPKEYLMRKCGAESLGAIIAADQLDQTATWTGVEVLSEFFGVVGYNPLDSEEQYPCATRRGCDQVVEALMALQQPALLSESKDKVIFAFNAVLCYICNQQFDLSGYELDGADLLVNPNSEQIEGYRFIFIKLQPTEKKSRMFIMWYEFIGGVSCCGRKSIRVSGL